MDGYNVTTAEVARTGAGIGVKPARTSRRLRRAKGWLPFLFCVALPTALGATYYYGMASDQYLSEAEFIIRSPSKGPASPLAGLLQGTGISKAEDDTYAVNEYLKSRDALAELVKNDDLRAVYAPQDADFLARFPSVFSRNDSLERFYDYYKDHVDVLLDTSTGVTTLTVRTFSAADSQRIASALLSAGEQLVNRLNERAMANALTDARKEVARMEARVTDVQGRIAAFRNRETLLDPTKQSMAILQGVADLQKQLSETQIFIAGLTRTSPNSPQLVTAQRRASALQAQIDALQSKVAGSDSSMVPRISEYDALVLQQEFADKALTSALTSLETSRADAERQHLYLERVVEPNLSDYSLYPRRGKFTAIVFATFLGLYLIGKVLVSGVREHRAH
jgi:capsular polysaccharide transport system permease protein